MQGIHIICTREYTGEHNQLNTGTEKGTHTHMHMNLHSTISMEVG